MVTCKIIQDPQLFKLPSKWQEVSPTQKGNVVDDKGEAIGTAYTGSRYKVICKAQLTKIEHIKRLARGILALIFTFGIAYLCCNKVKSLLTRKYKLYITPDVQDEPKKEKIVNEPKNNEQTTIPKEEKLQKIIPDINQLGVQKLVDPVIPEIKPVQKQEAVNLNIEPVIPKPIEPIIPEPKEVTLEQARQALEEGLEISQRTMALLQVLMPKIAKREKGDDLKFIQGQYFTTFTIPEEPNIVFKIANHDMFFFGSDDEPKLPRGGKEQTEKRFENTVKGKQVIMRYNLDLLCIPATKIVYIENDGYQYAIMAEKRLSFKDGEFTQQDLYYKNAAYLKPLVKQQARFIFEIGDDDVRWSNYPLLDPQNQTEQEADKKLQCGVIDLEWAGKKPIDGFRGGEHNSPGLIGMMPNEELIDLVIEESKKLGLDLTRKNPWSFGSKDDAASAKNDQLSKIKGYYRYQEFHKEKGIINGDEPFMSNEDIDKLGLDLDEKDEYKEYDINDNYILKTCTLREAVLDVVNRINKSINNGKSNHVKLKRHVNIPVSCKPFSIYQNLGLPKEKIDITWQDERQLWLNRILIALREKGYIFTYEQRGGHGYYVKC